MQVQSNACVSGTVLGVVLALRRIYTIFFLFSVCRCCCFILRVFSLSLHEYRVHTQADRTNCIILYSCQCNFNFSAAAASACNSPCIALCTVQYMRTAAGNYISVVSLLMRYECMMHVWYMCERTSRMRVYYVVFTTHSVVHALRFARCCSVCVHTSCPEGGRRGMHSSCNTHAFAVRSKKNNKNQKRTEPTTAVRLTCTAMDASTRIIVIR